MFLTLSFLESNGFTTHNSCFTKINLYHSPTLHIVMEQNQEFNKIINSLTYDELVELKKDLEAGVGTLRKIVDSKIKETDEAETVICVTCGKKIIPAQSEIFTLIWGPPDFRKKANFCALDCIDFFMEELRRIQKEKAQSEEF